MTFMNMQYVKVVDRCDTHMLKRRVPKSRFRNMNLTIFFDVDGVLNNQAGKAKKW